MAEEIKFRDKYTLRPIENDFKNFEYRGRLERKQVYEIPLEAVFYNDLNGRVITVVLGDEAKRGGAVDYSRLLHENLEEYQRRFEEFIEKQNPGKLKELKKSIQEKGQQEPGIVLSDGRIIDGNRRYTALRKIARETGKPVFFNAVVLPAPEGDDAEGWRYVKMLELNISLAKMQPLEYTPIARLADFYRATKDPGNIGRLSPVEYQNNAGMKKSEIERLSEELDVALDFLKWKETPLAFDYLEKKSMDGPLREIARARKRWTEADYESVKPAIYAVLDKGEGDTTRVIRDFLKNLWHSPSARKKAVDFSIKSVSVDGKEGAASAADLLRDTEESVYEDGDFLAARDALERSSRAYKALNDFLAYENIRAFAALNGDEQKELRDRLLAIRSMCLDDRALFRWAFGEDKKD